MDGWIYGWKFLPNKTCQFDPLFYGAWKCHHSPEKEHLLGYVYEKSFEVVWKSVPNATAVIDQLRKSYHPLSLTNSFTHILLFTHSRKAGDLSTLQRLGRGISECKPAFKAEAECKPPMMIAKILCQDQGGFIKSFLPQPGWVLMETQTFNFQKTHSKQKQGRNQKQQLPSFHRLRCNHLPYCF